jgi:hypothetical protein
MSSCFDFSPSPPRFSLPASLCLIFVTPPSEE